MPPLGGQPQFHVFFLDGQFGPGEGQQYQVERFLGLPSAGEPEQVGVKELVEGVLAVNANLYLGAPPDGS